MRKSEDTDAEGDLSKRFLADEVSKATGVFARTQFLNTLNRENPLQPVCFSRDLLRLENQGPTRKVRKWNWSQGWSAIHAHITAMARALRFYVPLIRLSRGEDEVVAGVGKTQLFAQIMETVDRGLYGYGSGEKVESKSKSSTAFYEPELRVGHARFDELERKLYEYVNWPSKVDVVARAWVYRYVRENMINEQSLSRVGVEALRSLRDGYVAEGGSGDSASGATPTAAGASPSKNKRKKKSGANR